MTSSLSVAIAQCPADLDPGEPRLDWLQRLLNEHEGPPLDLVVLPELFQCAYRADGSVVNLAETADGLFARSMAKLAKQRNLAFIYGFSERDGEKLYNSAQCIDAFGNCIGQQRKVLLPPGFEGDHFSPGSKVELFELGGFRLAILVCYDVEFPETARHAALAGADIIVVPTALAEQWSVVAERVVPSRAFENGVYLCYANYCGGDVSKQFLGSSCIVAPDGHDVARAGAYAELITAVLDKSMVQAAQNRLPYHKDRKQLPWVQ